MSAQTKLLLAFYGDDFTGSTDALEFLSRAGAKTVLFIEPPTAEQLQLYEGLQAIGVAGMTRAMNPEQMEETLRPAFTSLRELGVSHVHYKVCSTFDSSPSIGSIGKAIDIGAEIFSSRFIPVVVGAPALGRYCVFGNLFARMGIGSFGNIYRLDRHPSMSKHPTTPADESDLLLHLAKQTSKKIGLIDILEVDLAENEAQKKLEAVIEGGAEVIFFDALCENQMESIGRLISSQAVESSTFFSVGSSGVDMALGAYWQSKGVLQPHTSWEQPGKAEPLLVASGSCSPVTSGQIAWALLNGFAEVVLAVEPMNNNENIPAFLEGHITQAASFINDGISVIVHTGGNLAAAKGNDDNGYKSKQITSTAELCGTALGNIVRAVAEQTSIKRIVIAGGDTSSYAARAMGIEAVEMIAPLSPGAPLCKAYAPGSSIDGLEVNFKGGQVGSEDYFGMVRNGSFSASLRGGGTTRKQSALE